MKWVFTALVVVAALVAIIGVVGSLLPKGHNVSRSSRFQKPPETVWAVITGPPTWRPGLRSYEELPSREGRRRWKEVDQHGDAITYEAIEEIPPVRLVTHIADPGLPYGGYWIQEIKREPESCELTVTEDGEIYNPFFRFMARFIFGYTSTIDGYLKALHTKLGEPAE
jgi:hypothetical protein